MAMRAMTDSQMSAALSEMSDSISSLIESVDFLRRKANEKIDQYSQSHQSSDDMKICRVLKSFVDNLPEYGSKVVSNFIIEHHEDEIPGLGTHLLAILICTKSTAGKTPVTESPFTPPDDVASTMIDTAHRDQESVKLRCLRRDRYQCLITGCLDENSRTKFPELSDDEFMNRYGPTHASHIFPFKLGEFKRNTPEERDHANFWTTLHQLFPDLVGVLSQGDINEERNVITTTSILNDQIGLLRLALERRPELEQTAEENVYSVQLHKFPGFFLSMLPAPNAQGERIVRFAKQPGVNIELPSPAILEAHAALARVLHASGMAEQIEKFLRDQEEIVEKIQDIHEFSSHISDLLARRLSLLVH